MLVWKSYLTIPFIYPLIIELVIFITDFFDGNGNVATIKRY